MRNLAIKLKQKGYWPVIGVPCSRLKDFIEEFNDCIFSTSEHEAIMRASGYAACGHKPVVFLQNSGIGDLVDPILSFLIPAEVRLGAIVISKRGADGDALHHVKYGEVTDALVDLINIREVAEVFIV